MTHRSRGGVEPPAARKRIPELDGLRGIAILLVLLFHFRAQSGPLAGAAPVLGAGWIGVDLFFVLSGFLITGILVDSVERPHYYRNFWMRRTLRIFPLYYASLALLCAIVYFLRDPVHWSELVSWGAPLWFVFYLGNFRVAAMGGYPPTFAFSPLWSLQVEEQFYLVYPIIVRKTYRGLLPYLLMAAIPAAVGFRWLTRQMLPESELAAYVLTPCRMDALACGGLLALWMRSRTRPKPAPRVALSIAASLTALSGLMFAGFGTAEVGGFVQQWGYTLLCFTFTAWLAYVLAAPDSLLCRALRWGPLRGLGVISYGLYLLHLPSMDVAIGFVRPWFGTSEGGTVESLVGLAASIIAATCSWFFFESFFLRLKNRF